MPKLRLLVTGGSGLLGSALVRVASPAYDVVHTYHRHPVHLLGAEGVPLDLAADDRIVLDLLREMHPEIVIHTAALRSLDYCQDHPTEAFRVNTQGTRKLADAAWLIEACFVLISTDSVFDGKRGMYREEDSPNPITVYGQSKLDAERVALEHHPSPLIIRTSSIYGRSLFGQSLAEFILAKLQADEQIEMIDDSTFSPAFSDNLAEAILELASAGNGGLYHLAGPDPCTRYEFARAIARAFGTNDTHIHRVSLEQMKSRFSAPRSKDLSLDVSHARAAIQRTRLMSVAQGVHAFRETMQVQATQCPAGTITP